LFDSGETMTDIIAAVVTREPDWRSLPASTPLHIRRLLERCLRKDVKTRLQAIGEARIAIDEPGSTLSAVTAPTAGARRQWAWVIAAAAILAAGAGWWHATRPPQLRRLV